MINVHTMDVNDPRRAEMEKKCEEQAKAYEALQGGEFAMMGNTWDVWNQLGIPWEIYKRYKQTGLTDEEIAEEVKKYPVSGMLKARIEQWKNL